MCVTLYYFVMYCGILCCYTLCFVVLYFNRYFMLCCGIIHYLLFFYIDKRYFISFCDMMYYFALLYLMSCCFELIYIVCYIIVWCDVLWLFMWLYIMLLYVVPCCRVLNDVNLWCYEFHNTFKLYVYYIQYLVSIFCWKIIYWKYNSQFFRVNTNLSL